MLLRLIRPNFSSRTFTVLLLLVILVCPGRLVSAEEVQRPEHFGCSVAYPETEIDLTRLVSPTGIRIETVVPLILSLDSAGSVISYDIPVAGHSTLSRYFDAFISSCKFAPARRQGDAIASRLPIVLTLRPRDRVPGVLFPIDSLGVITDHDLYFSAVEFLGIELPQLRKFPSFFCNLSWRDTISVTHSILIKVDLDSQGEISGRELISSTYPQFTPQLMAAVCWSEFAPARVNGVAVESSAFVRILFFSNLSYPTPVRDYSTDVAYTLLEAEQVRLLYDTVGLMSVPLPRIDPNKPITLTGKSSTHRGSISLVLTIDSSGAVRFRRFLPVSVQTRDIVRRFTKQTSFFPALDFTGRAVRYHGAGQLDIESRKTVRFTPLWLTSGYFRP